MKVSTWYVLFSLFSSFLFMQACNGSMNNQPISKTLPKVSDENPSIVVLGTTQDAGAPQMACRKACCKDRYEGDMSNRHRVVSLGLLLPKAKKKYIFEATPDIVSQWHDLSDFSFTNENDQPDGIFLTHAHIGHYTGLMYLGKESMNAKETPVYAMPRMQSFLEQNGPWDQLIRNKNIKLKSIQDSSEIQLTEDVEVLVLQVPHRDEYSETVGFIISGPHKSLLFIPDIDKWHKWDSDIIRVIASVDYALIDATFFDAEEIKVRDMSAIPHPFVVESMDLFKDLPLVEKQKIYFIHLNHTNPILNPLSDQSQLVEKQSFHVARAFDVFEL